MYGSFGEVTGPIVLTSRAGESNGQAKRKVLESCTPSGLNRIWHTKLLDAAQAVLRAQPAPGVPQPQPTGEYRSYLLTRRAGRRPPGWRRRGGFARREQTRRDAMWVFGGLSRRGMSPTGERQPKRRSPSRRTGTWRMRCSSGSMASIRTRWTWSRIRARGQAVDAMEAENPATVGTPEFSRHELDAAAGRQRSGAWRLCTEREVHIADRTEQLLEQELSRADQLITTSRKAAGRIRRRRAAGRGEDRRGDDRGDLIFKTSAVVLDNYSGSARNFRACSMPSENHANQRRRAGEGHSVSASRWARS